MANSDHLADTMRTFSHARSLLREVYASSVNHCSVIQDLIREDKGLEDMTFIMEDDKRLIENVMNSDPFVIVSGQINCGKTSLINELLGGSYLPTSRLPCTARIVRIKYAEENYLQVYDEHGAPIGKKITFVQKVPREEIDLSSESRDNETEVKRTVEVGLKHPMLAHGLQIVDLPGLSESEALNNVVTKVLGGMMQLLIYVIDGKNSLRTQDVTFLSYLKNIAPNMDIIFVCNKVEVDLTATEADRWDDGSTEKSEDKAELAFFKLQKCRLIPPTHQYGLRLENYHGISCTRVREARMENRDDEFMDNFYRFKAALMSKLTECVQSHHSQAIMQLSMTQRRLHDFVGMDNVIKVDEYAFRDSLNDFSNKQEIFLKATTENVTKKFKPTIEKMLQDCLEREMAKVPASMEALEFPSVVMNDDIGANRLKNCRQQLREYVLMLFNIEFETVVSRIETWFNEEVKVNAPKFTVATRDYERRILQTYLPTIWRMDDMKFTMAELKTKWVTTLRERVNTKLKKYYEDMKFRIKGELNLDTKWKVETGLAVLRSIDTKSLTAEITAAINHKLQKDSFNCIAFSGKLNDYYYSSRLPDIRDGMANHARDILKEKYPDYCRNLIVIDALCTTLTHGAITLGKRIGKGSRMEVFECNEWNQIYNSRCGQSLHLVAKKEIVKSAHPFSALCTHYCRSRMMPDMENLQKVTAVVYDKDWNLCIILPHYDGTLHDVLIAGITTLEQRMKMCLDLTRMCLKVSRHGFILDDLRLNNFLVRNIDGVLTVCYNLSKWMDQLAPLPDGGVPFHFAPEIKRGEKLDPNTYDAYSMAVLLLLMAIGRFVRPRWSESDETVHRLMTESNPEVVGDHILKDFLHILECNWTVPKAKFYVTLVDVLELYLAANRFYTPSILGLVFSTDRLLELCTNLDS